MLEAIIKSLKRTVAIAGLSFGLYGCGDNVTINNYFNFPDGGSAVQSDSSVQNDGSADGEVDVLSAIPDAGIDGSYDSGMDGMLSPDGGLLDAAEPDAAPIVDAYVAPDVPPPCQQKLYFLDNDGDGYGNIAENALFCDGQQPNNYVPVPGDCDDADSLVWNETVAYLDADGDGYGAGNLTTICQGNPLPGGYALNDLDCDDSNTNISPAAPELCDYLDNNCNFSVDDGLGLGELCYNGVGECEREGAVVCSDDGLTTCDAVAGEPQFDLCGCKDNDCDGEIDCLDLEGKIVVTLQQNIVDGGSDRDIYVMDANGCNWINLTNYPAADDDDPAFSPDGTKIAFVSRRGGDSEIYVMNTDGSNLQNLTNSPFGDSNPQWSSDGTRIIHNRIWNEIYVMDADGSNVQKLSYLDSNYNYHAYGVGPVYSPDGLKIAYAPRIMTEPWDYEIYIMDSDGTNEMNLTNNPTDDYGPNWSPDGTKVAFVSERDGNAEIYSMNTDGSEQTNLTNNPVDDSSYERMYAWSPDGSKIIFKRGRNIWVMNADGNNQRNITNLPEDSDFTPYMAWGSNMDWKF